MAAQQSHARVLRSDGKYINLVLKTAHLFVCRGCCCGHVERGHAPVPEALYHSEWERRRLRQRVHLTIGGCLGPCPLANVVMLNFAGSALWFQSMNAEWQVTALYDYIEAMLAADRLLPVPEPLKTFVFNFYAWQIAGAPAVTDQTNYMPTVAPIVVLSHGGLENAPQLRWLANLCRAADRVLVAISAIQPDLQLDATSTDPAIAREIYAYFQKGGAENIAQALRFACDHYFATDYGFEPPRPQPKWGA